MKKFLIATVAAAAITGSALYATAENSGEGKKEPKQGMLGIMDTNNDSKVSQDEFLAHSKTMFGKMDANNDGGVTKEEMEAFHKSQKAEREKHKEEMEAKKEEHFKEMDKNGDGSISKEEMMQGRKGGHQQGGDASGGEHPEPEGGE